LNGSNSLVLYIETNSLKQVFAKEQVIYAGDVFSSEPGYFYTYGKEKQREFEQIARHMCRARLHEKRERLAHGEAISKALAADLCEIVSEPPTMITFSWYTLYKLIAF